VRLAAFLVLGSSAFVLGCSSDKEFERATPFRNEEDVQVWATNASAVAVYSNAYEPIAVADGQATFSDPECPVTSDDGTTLTISGGCTDAGGKEWTGEATVTREGDDRTLEFDDFDGKVGTVTLRLTAPSAHEFDVDLVIGSGRVEREGYFSPTGVVEATTADQVVDDAVCSGQPVSGSTTLHAHGDTAVVTYDGATDCDPDQNARLSVNGKDRGLVSGISCAMRSGTRRSSSFPFGLFALTILLARSRRRLRGD
jgi:hypothetical protein